MNFTPKTALAVFLAVAVLSLLLLASPEPRTTNAQQPDYTAQCSNGVVVPNPQDNPGLLQDCVALLAVQSALTDPHGVLNWSADIAISEWNGVELESTLDGGYFRNRVVELLIEDVSGSISPEIGSLSMVWQLAIHNSELTGSIPPELGNLSSLEWLNLNNNRLTGSIPPELGSISNLYRLYLRENQLTGSIPPELGNLSNLDGLYLNDNQLTGSIPPELGNLSNLDDLYLAGNQLTGCIPATLRNVSEHDFGSLGLPLCDYTPPSPTPAPTHTPAPTRTPAPGTPTPTATPIPPAVPDDVLNRLSAIETLLATLQNLLSALESKITALDGRIAALEADASRPTPTPAPVIPTPTPVPGVPTPTPVVPTPDEPCIYEFTNSGSRDGSWNEDCESVTSHRMLIDSGRGEGPHYALYYTFTLTAPANVTVTLDSDDQDTFLYLLSGKGANVGEIGTLDARHFNDDHGSRQDTDACASDGSLEQYDSCITKSLAAGDYTLEATTYNSRVTGSFTLTVSGIR